VDPAADGGGPDARGAALVCGIPWDEGSSFRRGPAGGPAAIRRSSRVLEEWSLWAGRDLRDAGLVDGGDWAEAAAQAPVAAGAEARATAADIRAWLARRASKLLAPGGLLVALGGDHLVTVPAVEWLAELAGRAGEQPPVVLVFDAHADLRDEYRGTRWSHACVTSLLLERLGPGRVQSVGVRSADEGEWLAAQAAGQVWATGRGGGRRDAGAVSRSAEPCDLVAEALAGLAALPADGALYLSIDIDVCDPGAAPGVGAPEPGGVSAVELLRAVRAVTRAAGGRLRAMDVVEVSPGDDAGGATATLAAKLVREICLGRGMGGG
jgi:agmatinase